MLTKCYTALHNLYNPDHNQPGMMIKSDSSETKHTTYTYIPIPISHSLTKALVYSQLTKSCDVKGAHDWISPKNCCATRRMQAHTAKTRGCAK